jgi:hypothetical protein
MGNLSRHWLSCLAHYVHLLPKTFKLLGIPIFSVPDEGYSRNGHAHSIIYLRFHHIKPDLKFITKDSYIQYI